MYNNYFIHPPVSEKIKEKEKWFLESYINRVARKHPDSDFRIIIITLRNKVREHYTRKEVLRDLRECLSNLK